MEVLRGGRSRRRGSGRTHAVYACGEGRRRAEAWGRREQVVASGEPRGGFSVRGEERELAAAGEGLVAAPPALEKTQACCSSFAGRMEGPVGHSQHI
jgi:hypothetical protein